MNRRSTLICLVVWATMAFAQQSNSRLSQLDAYLQKQRDNVNVDSIRNTFSIVSKEASDSYRYEYHRDGADSIKYELAFRSDDSDHQGPIREFARFYSKGIQAEYHHGHNNIDLTVSRPTPLTAMGQPDPRLKQLEEYLQAQGLMKTVDHKPNASKTKKRHNLGGTLTIPVKQDILDSIRAVFTDMSKEATESHLYENHKDGADTIEYALTLNATESVNFTYKKNSANQARGLYTHTYERDEVKPSDAIAAKQWRIDIRSMNTMRYGSRMVTPDFYLELRGDKLHSYLPYLGQARVSPSLSPSIGLNFEEPVLRYMESQPKSKKYTQIDIDVKTREDNYHYVVQLYDSGDATIRVRSLNRDAISFDGTLVTSN